MGLPCSVPDHRAAIATLLGRRRESWRRVCGARRLRGPFRRQEKRNGCGKGCRQRRRQGRGKRRFEHEAHGPALAPVVRQSRQPGHDGALSRALPQFRSHARRIARQRQARDRDRANRQRPLAVQPPSHRTRLARARRHPRRRRDTDRVSGPPDPGNRQATDRVAGPQPGVPDAGRSALRLPARRRRAHHRLRQDHAGDADGRGHRRHPGDRPVGRADAQRLLRRRAVGVRNHRLVRAPGTGGGPDRLRRVPEDGRFGRAVDRSLQHDGHRAVDEQPRRDAGHVAARLRLDSGAVSRTRADGLRHRAAHRRDGARRPQALGCHDPGGLREHDRGGERAGRVHQLPAARHGDRAAHGRARSRSATGTTSATRFRCSWT